MPQVRSEMIPDISIPEILIKDEAKYEIMLKENIKKVSVIALTRRKDACLKVKLVRNPKNNPILSETIPSIKNWAMITNGVYQTKSTDCNCSTVLNKMIDTMSFVTPSPKIQLKSFGCSV